MAQPPSKRPPAKGTPSKRPASGKSAPRTAASKPVRLKWDKPRKPKPQRDDAQSKGALERKDGEERIAKLLARAGVASRREIERMIADGRITLNGEKVETPATLLKSLHGVAVDGQPVKQPEPTKLYLFHKPANCLTAERDFRPKDDLRYPAEGPAAPDADRAARP